MTVSKGNSDPGACQARLHSVLRPGCDFETCTKPLSMYCDEIGQSLLRDGAASTQAMVLYRHQRFRRGSRPPHSSLPLPIEATKHVHEFGIRVFIRLGTLAGRRSRGTAKKQQAAHTCMALATVSHALADTSETRKRHLTCKTF